MVDYSRCCQSITKVPTAIFSTMISFSMMLKNIADGIINGSLP
jgi:hypothetical protein